MTQPTRYATLGDTVEADMEPPAPQTLRVLLETPAAVARANELIDAGSWRVVETETAPESSDA